MRPNALPVTVIGGYLGSGKTTLVNHLLRHSDGRRIAVAVNEFGSIPIDQDLIVGAQGDVLTLSGGCICCSIGDDLVGGLGVLAKRAGKLDCVLIEASGVALPRAIAQSLTLVQGLVHDATLVLVDCETVCDQIVDRYIGDTIARQIADADLIVLNKTDVASAAARARALATLAARAPSVRIVETLFSRVSPDVVFGIADRGGFVCAEPAPAHDTTGYATVALDLPDPVDVDRLQAALVDEAGLLRTKGFVRDADGAWKLLHQVGRRASATAAPDRGDQSGRLVCIALRHTIECSDIARIIAGCRV
jgi:G3E family GTPase